MLSGYHDLIAILPAECCRILKILKSTPVKHIIKTIAKTEEKEPSTSSVLVQENMRTIIHNMIQLQREDAVPLWMAVGQKYLMGEEGPSYASLINTYKMPRQYIEDAYVTIGNITQV